MKLQMAAAVTVVAALIDPALGQSFKICTPEGDGTFTPNFNAVPSMVVHSDAVMDTKRGDIGLGGTASERVFSFSRTISAVLASAGGDTSPAAQKEFVKSMLATFVPAETLPLNTKGGVVMPLDARGEAAALDAEKMLNESSDQAMKPLAVFNRFDLAPDNWAHCGEHRIIYARQPLADGPGRFLLIFEAMVPNPKPSEGKEGCRPVAEFWANLSEPGLSPTELARRLSAFYYEGKTSPALAAPDLLRPVVDYRNYGGDGGRGQVRANAFNPPPWQLREWLTQRTFNPAPASLPLTFVPVTAKDNPLAELYRDDLLGTTFLTKNPATAANLLHGQFLQSLTSMIALRLLSETTAQHQLLVNELNLYHLGTGVAAELTPDKVLLNTIALGNEDKFNEFQSTSQGLSDAPGDGGASLLVTQMLDQVGNTASPFVNPQRGQILLNRARAATCAGCHMTASRSAGGGFAGPGVVVLEKPNGTVVRWPDVDPGGFVQVSESRALSPTLTDAFLPFRRYVLARYLCNAPEPTPPEIGYEPYGDMPAPRTVAAAVGEGLVEETAQGGYFVEDLVRDFAAGAGVSQPIATPNAAETTSRVHQSIEALTPEQLSALREKVGNAIAIARNIELQRSGAFVETRRPH
ncbi:hypothetical protein [Rhizobium sp. BK538]|uniref:hypothetical protein n=1 Tax=Rhizobium sp. BK538 TaxID=2586984 RepID=UPI001619C7C5|nr:hypothetical protein [Rhizobium sp. BK538]MBB4170795.1 hypothetical protein [Rhizobium sp. BK538]